MYRPERVHEHVSVHKNAGGARRRVQPQYTNRLYLLGCCACLATADGELSRRGDVTDHERHCVRRVTRGERMESGGRSTVHVSCH